MSDTSSPRPEWLDWDLHEPILPASTMQRLAPLYREIELARAEVAAAQAAYEEALREHPPITPEKDHP